MKRFWNFFTIIFFIFIFLFLAIQIADAVEYENSDFFQFWLGSRDISEGIDPYNSEEWINDHKEMGTERIAAPVYLYPLPLAIILVPIGALPLKTAFIIWIFVSESFILIAIMLLLKAGNFSKTKHLLLPILIANIIFRPTTTTLFGGQFSAWLLLIATLTAIFWHNKKWFWGGVIIGFLSLKPSVGFPFLLILTPWLLARKKYPALKGIISTGIAFLSIGFLVDPLWIPKYIHILTTKLNNEFGNSPTIWGFSAMACHFESNCTAWLGSITLVLFLSLNIWLLSKWRFISPILSVGHLITISLLSTLYLWPYDHLLLIIPIVYIMVILLQKGVPYLKVSFIFLFISIASILLRLPTLFTSLKKETLYGLLPLLVWGLTTWVLISSPKNTEN